MYLLSIVGIDVICCIIHHIHVLIDIINNTTTRITDSYTRYCSYGLLPTCWEGRVTVYYDNTSTSISTTYIWHYHQLCNKPYTDEQHVLWLANILLCMGMGTRIVPLIHLVQHITSFIIGIKLDSGLILSDVLCTLCCM